MRKAIRVRSRTKNIPLFIRSMIPPNRGRGRDGVDFLTRNQKVYLVPHAGYQRDSGLHSSIHSSSDTYILVSPEPMLHSFRCSSYVADESDRC